MCLYIYVSTNTKSSLTISNTDNLQAVKFKLNNTIASTRQINISVNAIFSSIPSCTRTLFAQTHVCPLLRNFAASCNNKWHCSVNETSKIIIFWNKECKSKTE